MKKFKISGDSSVVVGNKTEAEVRIAQVRCQLLAGNYDHFITISLYTYERQMKVPSFRIELC